MIDLNELQIYSAVCAAKNFTRAAEHLGIPKSSVSRAIQGLEQRLGLRLLQRTTRSLQLTEAGERYLEHCRRIVEEADQADAEIAGLTAVPRGRLRIGAPGAFIHTVLAGILGDFIATYPELRVQVQLLNPDTLRDRNCDVVIWGGPVEDSPLFISPVFRIRPGLYASPRYLQGRTVPRTPAEVRNHQCITMNCGVTGMPSDSVVWRMRRGAEVAEVRVPSHVAVPDPSMGYRLALSGAGLCLAPQFLARNHVASGELVRILPEWEPEPVNLHALYSSRLANSPKVRAFLEFLRERFDARFLMETDGSAEMPPVSGASEVARSPVEAAS